MLQGVARLRKDGFEIAEGLFCLFADAAGNKVASGGVEA